MIPFVSKCYVDDWDEDRTKFTLVSYDDYTKVRLEFEPDTEEERKLMLDSILDDIPIYITMGKEEWLN